jgi:hypothetical protein
MTDQLMFTSDGTNLIYVGANQVNQRITNSLTIDNAKNIYFKTVNTSAAHGFAIGDIVLLHNVVTSSSDLTYRVKSVPSSTSFTVARTATDGSLTLGASPTVNIYASIVLGGSAGTVVISLSDEVTADLTPATYVYDLELTSSTGDVTRLIQGAFVVDPEVTTT